MDNIFGIGLPELILILAIAGMVMGPERIARTARSLGVMVARLQEVSRSFFRQLSAELDSVDEKGELKDTIEELNQLRRQVADLRDEVFSLTSGTIMDSKPAISKTEREMGRSTALPSLSAEAEKATLTTKDGSSVYRPPSWSGEDSAMGPRDEHSNGLATAPSSPMKLPRRVNISEDPDR